MRLQPDEGVRLWLMIKDPGPGGMRLRHVPLDMSFAQTFKIRSPEAYERLIMDVIRGNATLFMRRDEVEAAWKWIDPILDGWAGLARGAEDLYGRHMGAVGRDRADRARRPDLARGTRVDERPDALPASNASPMPGGGSGVLRHASRRYHT